MTTTLSESVADLLHVRRALSRSVPTDYPACPMTMFHMLAAAGDFADELRSLGLHKAPSVHTALVQCLAQLDHDPVGEHQAALRDAELADRLRHEQQQLRDVLAEPDVSFIVTPVEAEAHFMRDYDGDIKRADEVERRRARMQRDFGVDVL